MTRTTRRDFKGNIYRELLARAIERNGGYSSGYHDRYALEWNVALGWGVPDSDDLLRPRRGEGVWPTLDENWRVTQEQFRAVVPSERLAEWCAEWDDESHRQSAWECARDSMAQWFHGSVQGTTYGGVRPEIANRYGLQYLSPRKFVRNTGAESTYFPAKVPGWKIEGEYANVPDFDARFEFAGRQGKHLCMTEFEGISLQGSGEDLAERIRTPDESGYWRYGNAWCQDLLAYIHECDLMFSRESVKTEFVYLCMFYAADEVHDLYEKCVQAEVEAKERLYWAERDVVTT